MTIFDVLELLCGLALFIYGMDAMGDAIKRSAGSRLKTILESLTSSSFKGFLLGLGVTCVIQSSSATTVMVVGFVNSGIMTLYQAVGVIIGANVGTAITAWITALSGIGGSAQTVTFAFSLLKPDTWVPILALIGLILLMFSKRNQKRNVGVILLSFAILMVGMDMMSAAVSGLKDNLIFQKVLTTFQNPVLGVLAGTVFTAIVQSSSASIGILQSLSTTGAITYSAAIPIIMGQNIGTCATAMISSAGTNKNARRSALIHLYYNIINVVVWMILFYLFDGIFQFAFMEHIIDMWGIAGVHTIFKILSALLFLPFTKLLVKLACITIRDSQEDTEDVQLLDDRLLETPAIAIESCAVLANKMANDAILAMSMSIETLHEYDEETAEKIVRFENKIDHYEDVIGSYLIKVSSYDIAKRESEEVTKILHAIGDFERISDHAVNLLRSAEEMREKKIVFSAIAQKELSVLSSAVSEILELTKEAYVSSNLSVAKLVEPLEQVVDALNEQIKANHVQRLQKAQCTIELGFVLSDVLTNLSRVSDHCSNIAGCVLELGNHDSLNMHDYLNQVKTNDTDFDQLYAQYLEKYTLQSATTN